MFNKIGFIDLYHHGSTSVLVQSFIMTQKARFTFKSIRPLGILCRSVAKRVHSVWQVWERRAESWCPTPSFLGCAVVEGGLKVMQSTYSLKSLVFSILDQYYLQNIRFLSNNLIMLYYIFFTNRCLI